MYNIKSVAKLLDMPAVTIRAWERRYHVVAPTRSESGHRLYSEQDIDDLRWLKIQTEEKGVNISQAVKLLEKMREQRNNRPSLPAVGEPQEMTYDGLREDLYEAMTSFDSERANSILNLGFALYHYEEMFHLVLAPILQRIGDDWEQGRVTVMQEHFASNLIFQRFHQFFRVFTVNPAMPKALAFCPEGEHHQIGLLLFSLFLRKNGVDLLYLGANTPLSGLGDLIVKNDIRLLVISLTNEEKLPAVEERVLQLKRQYPQVNIVLGGQGFAEVADELHEHVLCGGLTDWNYWFSEQVQSKMAKRG